MSRFGLSGSLATEANGSPQREKWQKAGNGHPSERGLIPIPWIPSSFPTLIAKSRSFGVIREIQCALLQDVVRRHAGHEANTSQ